MEVGFSLMLGILTMPTKASKVNKDQLSLLRIVTINTTTKL